MHAVNGRSVIFEIVVMWCILLSLFRSDADITSRPIRQSENSRLGNYIQKSAVQLMSLYLYRSVGRKKNELTKSLKKTVRVNQSESFMKFS